MAFAHALHVDVELARARHDAALVSRAGRRVILVSDRLHFESWGVFCVVHELAHLIGHPAPREFYIGSPGWVAKTESQANIAALLALWPRPAPYPRPLKIEFVDRAVHLLVAFTAASRYDLGDRWTSRRLTLQRYRA